MKSFSFLKQQKKMEFDRNADENFRFDRFTSDEIGEIIKKASDERRVQLIVWLKLEKIFEFLFK